MPAVIINRRGPRGIANNSNSSTIHNNDTMALTLPDGSNNAIASAPNSMNHATFSLPRGSSGEFSNATLGGDESKCKRRRRRHHPKASTLQIVSGCCFSILLLVFISGIDFQANKNIATHGQGLTTSLAYVHHIHEWTRAVFRTSNENNVVVGGGTTEDDRPPMLCRYDGQCPVRSTCAVSGPKDMRGSCEPMVVTAPPTPPSPPDTTSTPCLVSCLKELQKDEHFFQEKWPVVDWTVASYQSEGRPDGCIIVYHRQADQISHWKHLDEQDRQVTWREAPPSVIDWTNERFHHVKRVDPYIDQLTDNKWMAYCTNPCSKDSQCATTNDPPWGPNGFVCIDGACQRNPEYWGDALSINAVLTPTVAALANQPKMVWGGSPNITTTAASASSTLISVAAAPAEMVLVTGATSSYYRGLMNLAASARYWAPRHKMVVYNLGGLNAQHLAEIQSWSNVLSVEWPQGVPEHYPNHVHEGKKYAWKPIISTL